MREKGKKVMCLVLGLLMMVCMLQTNVEAATKVKLNKSKTTIYAGQQETLKLKGAKAKKWTSSNKKVATVNSKGVVKAKAKGTAKITCKAANGKKYTCKVTVNEPRLVKDYITVKAGQRSRVMLLGAKAVKWTSSNNKIATVDDIGYITTYKNKKGTVKITCYADNGKKYTCKVDVY